MSNDLDFKIRQISSALRASILLTAGGFISFISINFNHFNTNFGVRVVIGCANDYRLVLVRMWTSVQNVECGPWSDH